MEENLGNFALNEEEFNQFKDIKIGKSMEELENFDFSGDTELNMDEYYEMVHLYNISQTPDTEKKEAIKSQEAENVIEKYGETFLGKEFVEKYKKERENLSSFLRRYEVNTDLVKNMTEEEKDKIYEIANFLFDNFQKIHNNLDFIFPLSFEEYKFINEVIIKKLEYDRDGVFQIRELKNNYLSHYPKFIKDNANINEMGTTIDINMTMVLYHHITRYKVKGAQTDFELFLSLVIKMEERLLLYNACKTITDRLSQDFMVWGGALTVDDIGLKVNEPELKVVDEVTGDQIKSQGK